LDEQIVKKFSTAEVREKLDESIDAALLWLEDNEGPIHLPFLPIS